MQEKKILLLNFQMKMFILKDQLQHQIQMIIQVNQFNLQHNLIFFQRIQLIKIKLSDLYRIEFDNNDKITIVPTLIEPLENIIKNPGINPISEFKNHQNYNYLKPIQRDAQMNKFDVYVPPSKDITLQQFVKALNFKYWYFINLFLCFNKYIFQCTHGFNGPDFSNIFEQFPDEPRKFMISQRKPTSALLHRVDENIFMH